jgi:hypothetical protein
VFRRASRPDQKFHEASECSGTYGPLSLTVISLQETREIKNRAITSHSRHMAGWRRKL